MERMICAVADCIAPGKAHLCPADDERHHHGRIHYTDCHTKLRFRQGWYFICDEHYAVCVEARASWEKEVEVLS